mmetsp:Transcript_58387/g.125621  ORF Transcript_58387/g.125621 Transcript_58387/m.125621 type:complete len:319 (-) Transcript_58387:699-1655(-)
MHRRAAANGMFVVPMPSISIVPSTSARWANAMNRELLPLPVRPQIPTLTPPGHEKVTPLRITGKSSRYRICTPRKAIAPALGKPFGGWVAPPVGSASKVLYASSLSKLVMKDSTMADIRTMYWKRPDSKMVCRIARPISSGATRSRTKVPPNAANTMMTTHCMSSRNPMNRLGINHQNHALALASSLLTIANCAASCLPKARMHSSPRSVEANVSNTGLLLRLSRRFNSVMDFTQNRLRRIMYQKMARNPGITGGTAAQTSTAPPNAMQLKSRTSCMDCESCSSTLLRSPLKRFRMRPAGLAEKKPNFAPRTELKAPA